MFNNKLGCWIYLMERKLFQLKIDEKILLDFYIIQKIKK